jgi:pyrroline-5-carboxylate reductase
MIQTKLQPASQITVFDVSTSALNSISKTYPDIIIAQNLQQVVEDADLVVCAVKPQNLSAEFFQRMEPPTTATLLSVIAGTPMSTFLQGGFTKVARSMPNTPAQIGKGMTVWCCTSNLQTEERDKITRVLSSFGKQIYVDDESFIDISTSISGSGPAYVFMLMEAMIDAGVHMGFSRSTATTLVNQTILGSTLYAMETGEHPVILRNSVTSPAGTTASAIYELDNGKFRTVVKDAIWACYRRSLEMGDKDSNVGPGRVHRQEIVIVPKGEAHFEGILQGLGNSTKK